MKKFTIGFLVGAILMLSIGVLATTFNAETATFPILVNGVEWKTDKPAVIINGSTYLPLRALGNALNTNINWNNNLSRVEIGGVPVDKKVFTEGNFSFIAPRFTKDSYGWNGDVEIKNNSQTKKTITFTVTFYDGTGNRLGTAMGNVFNLESGATKTEKLLISDDITGWATSKFQIDAELDN